MTAPAAQPGDAARVGVFGGTFNPIHVAHLRAAEEVAEALDLAVVRFLPSGSPPHKSAGRDDPLAPAEERLRWVRLAIADNSRFAADTRELERGGPSYMVDTLRDTAAELAPERPVLLIGSDAFSEIGAWREPKALLGLAHFAVVARPGGPGTLRECLPPELGAELELSHDGCAARHRSAGTWLRSVAITALDVSASDVRRRIRERRSVRYLLPERIHDAVVTSGIYGPGGAVSEGPKEDRAE